MLSGNLSACNGAIYGNIIADILGRMGRKLYYFRKESGLEVDFVTRYKNECFILEVKSRDGRTKSAATILKHPEKYNVYHCIKLGKYNVGRANPGCIDIQNQKKALTACSQS